MGSAKEVAIGNGCFTGPEDTRDEDVGTAMGDGGNGEVRDEDVGTTVNDGDAEGWVPLANDTRSAAGSAHPAARTARAKPASAADVRDDMQRSSYGTTFLTNTGAEPLTPARRGRSKAPGQRMRRPVSAQE
jgi:hypothetical protein